MSRNSDERQLELIQQSVLDPEKEEEAKKILLRELYSVILSSYEREASNGGLISELPSCVKDYLDGKREEPCEEDMSFTYNAIRVLMSRYLSRSKSGNIIETPSMVFKRVTQGFKGLVDTEALYKLLISKKFIFNSPTLFNMYINGAKGSLSACYVTPVYDDMNSIMKATEIQAITFKYGGGQGFSFSNLRPRWDLVKGTGGYSSGPLSFMKIYDVVTESVKQGGKRRGANMGILHVWHPDIINPHFSPLTAYYNSLPTEFKVVTKVLREMIEALEKEGYEVSEKIKSIVKQGEGYEQPEDAGFIQAKEGKLGDVFLTNFNISVGINDKFMESVLTGEQWIMVNPKYTGITTRVGDYKIHYSYSPSTGKGLLGILVEKGVIRDNPFINNFDKIITEAKEKLEGKADINTKNSTIWKYPAKKIWDKIVENAWKSGDPGLLFLDNHNKWNPTPWLGVVVATNPCGEQYLYPFESCNLGSISVEKYVRNKKFNINNFYKDIQVIVDAMDSVIDLNRQPIKEQEIVNKFTRKIGLGIMGLADLLAKLEIPYDSDEAVAVTLVLMAGLEAFSWKRSWELGKERGYAPAFECEIYDWNNQTCMRRGDPRKLVDMHIPALVKAGYVTSIRDGWLTVNYHDVDITSIADELTSESLRHLDLDGSVRLVKIETIWRVLERIFGIEPITLEEALRMNARELVNNPRHLLVTAVFYPYIAWKKLREYGEEIGAIAPRNTVTTTIAPTGSISIIAGTSSGIEPYFAIVFKRKVAVGEFLEVVREFRNKMTELKEKGEIDDADLERIYEEITRNKGSIREAYNKLSEQYPEIRSQLEKMRDLYPTSMDISAWYHLAHQIAAQLYVDQSISKTINIKKDAPVRVVNTIYFVGWLGGLKGVTVYRDESKEQQVIYFGSESNENYIRKKKTKATRMILPKAKIRIGELGKDKRFKELFNIKKTSGNEVVVDIDVNSTCKTCDL